MKSSNLKCIYPGSFDPVTMGHIDVIMRGYKLFQEIIVAISEVSSKQPFFSIEERKEMMSRAMEEFGLKDVKVVSYKGLTVEIARFYGAKVILRGIRSSRDYEVELQKASLNSKMAPEIETVFMFPAEKYIHLSSSIVREIGISGGDLTGMVPEVVKEYFKKGKS